MSYYGFYPMCSRSLIEKLKLLKLLISGKINLELSYLDWFLLL